MALQKLSSSLVKHKKTTLSEMLNVAFPLNADVYDIFILYGQSNTVGYADNTPGYPAVVDNDVMYLNLDTDTITKVVKGIKHTSGDVSTGHAWASFGNEYRRITGRKILFVPCARGATPIEDLVPGTSLFNKMVEAVNKAKQLLAAMGLTTGKVSLLYHQGEANMSAGTSRQAYQDSLVSLVNGVVDALSIDRFFFLRVGCPQTRSEETWYAVQAAQDYICQSFNSCNMVFSDFGAYTQGNGLLRSDGTHATQHGYNYMGQQAAKNVAEAFLNNSQSSPAEMQHYGVPLLPKDQIWRLTAGRVKKVNGSWVLLDRNTSGGTHRTCNIRRIEVSDTKIRLWLQSRADWMLESSIITDHTLANYGIRAVLEFKVDGNTAALDITFVGDISFGCSKSGVLTSAPDLRPVNSIVNGNLSTSLDGNGNVVVTHQGSYQFPTVIGFAGADGTTQLGYVGVANPQGNSFTIVNQGAGGVLCTLPGAFIKPTSLLDGMEVGVSATVCERKD